VRKIVTQKFNFSIKKGIFDLIMKETKTILILDNIRSVQNVGAIFRTAEAAKVDKIYLLGYTPAPIDRFNRERNDFKKSALGAEKIVNWEIVDEKIFDQLKEEGFQIVSVEQSEKSTDYKEITVSDKNAIVFGNEVDGVSRDIIEISDVVAEIPMRGKKESLNVTTSVGIFLYRFLDI
jgi:tRNA G18 (ribose-2'-O)-methylase SpoU